MCVCICPKQNAVNFLCPLTSSHPIRLTRATPSEHLQLWLFTLSTIITSVAIIRFADSAITASSTTNPSGHSIRTIISNHTRTHSHTHLLAHQSTRRSSPAKHATRQPLTILVRVFCRQALWPMILMVRVSD